MSDSKIYPAVSAVDFVLLRQHIADAFNKSDLKVACFDLKIKYDNLAGETLDEKVIELIDYCKRYGLVLSLIRYCEEKRPHIIWVKSLAPQPTPLREEIQREQQRRDIQKQQRYVHLVHTLHPPQTPNQRFDILIYLMRQREDKLSDIRYAEFFFGKYWGNNIFRVPDMDGFMGMTIAAYGPVLCTCKVVFHDNYDVILQRYIDFEMGDRRVE